MFKWLKNWTVDGLIIGSTILATVGEIVLNFITSYGHISLLGWKYGEKGVDGDLTPVIIDFALFAFAMLNLFLARKGRYVEVKKTNGRVKRKPEFRWPRWVLGGGVAATVAANVAYGMWWGYTGALIAAFAAVMLFFTIEGAMLLLRVAAEEAEKVKAELPSFTPFGFTDSDIPAEVIDEAKRRLAKIDAERRLDESMTYPAPVLNGTGPGEGTEVPEPEGKAQAPGLSLPAWRALNGHQ